MTRAISKLSVAQFDLLRWVAAGCKDGFYEGSSHRVSARALHNRGLVSVSGNGATWAVQITPDGVRRLQEEAKRIEVERERAHREEQERQTRERKRQELRDRASQLLANVIAAGGRLDLGPGVDTFDIRQLQDSLAQSGRLPTGQRLAQEPTRMDPVLGVTVYLEPDFRARITVRAFDVPRQLRNPHPAVLEFQSKKALVSKAQIGRTARFLQGFIDAVNDVGWKIPSNSRNMPRAHGEPAPDLLLKLPSRELVATIRELDQRGRRHQAYVTQNDYYLRTARTTANTYFQASGTLEVTITKSWESETLLSIRDAPDAPLEEQLPILIQKLEIAEAEAQWSRQEESRRAEVRETRWEEVKKEAFTKLTYQRNAELLRDQLERRQAVTAMRIYADEIDSKSAQFDTADRDEARRWSEWIREHADSIDPINGPLSPLRITSANHGDLDPYMNGWSSYSSHRR